MKIIKTMLASCLLLGSTAQAELDPYIGEIQFFGGNFAPRGWAFCDGQLLPIAQYQALFSILGTTYGGDGRTTFALPDMRGRLPIHKGNGPGLTPRNLGEIGGSETNTLAVNQMPAHSHTLNANSGSARTSAPTNNTLARTRSDLRSYDSVSASKPADAQLASSSVGNTGSSAPINNMQPSLAINCIIALEGVFPPRN